MRRIKIVLLGMLIGAALMLSARYLFGGPQIESVRLLSTTGCTFIVSEDANGIQKCFHAADCEKCAKERAK
jgi:hypothetical protein